MNRESFFLQYAFSHDLGSPRRLLGLAIEESFNTDLAVLSTTNPRRAAFLAVARFEYEVKKGGFAQLLFNMRNQGVEVLGNALVYAGAKEAAQAYGAALALCRENPAGYHGFLASDFRSPNAFKDALHGVSLPYLRGTPIEVETAALIACFVDRDSIPTELAALDGRSLGEIFKHEFPKGPVGKPLLDAVAGYLRAHRPPTSAEFFDGLGGPLQGNSRLAEELMAGDPSHAIVLAILLTWPTSDDWALVPWLEWALSLRPEYAVEVLDFLRSGVADPYGDFAARKPAGVWPSMKIFPVLRTALNTGDASIRDAITRIPGPWSWTSAELASARDRADYVEVEALKSFG